MIARIFFDVPRDPEDIIAKGLGRLLAFSVQSWRPSAGSTQPAPTAPQ
jgi:hypothetical protein